MSINKVVKFLILQKKTVFNLSSTQKTKNLPKQKVESINNDINKLFMCFVLTPVVFILAEKKGIKNIKTENNYCNN